MNALIQNCSRENTSNYRVDVNSWELLCFCKGFPNFYIKWVQIYRETGLKEGHLSTPQHDEYISNANLSYKFQIRNLKRKWKIRYSFLFWLGKKSLLLQISSFPWRLSCHHNGHTRSMFSSIHCQITWKIKMKSGFN